MTIREEIQQKIDSYKAEIAILEDHIAKAGNTLDQEEAALKAWVEDVIHRIRTAL